jgi:hypothetical protein
MFGSELLGMACDDAAGGGLRWLDRIGWILEATAAGGIVNL